MIWIVFPSPISSAENKAAGMSDGLVHPSDALNLIRKESRMQSRRFSAPCLDRRRSTEPNERRFHRPRQEYRDFPAGRVARHPQNSVLPKSCPPNICLTTSGVS